VTLLERAPLLARLGVLLDEARRGHGHLALLAGEAGVGKTTLLDAFCSEHPTTRTLRGACDPVTPPRPFAPLFDMAATSGGQLRSALEIGDRDTVIDAFAGLIRPGAGTPTLVVLEDMHWADEALLDLLRVVGRRVDRTSALIIVSYRNDEVGGHHPLRLALGDVPTQATVELPVPPLSPSAVAQLARGSDIDAAELFAVTGGNAFFVTEVLAAGGSTVPVAVRDAVLARVRRLPAAARRVVEAAAIIGQPCEPAPLLRISGQDEDALEACLARGVLRIDDEAVGFRHELARRAVLDGMPRALRMALHRSALDALGEGVTASDPARLARHAVGAGDISSVIALAPAAGRWAADLGAHREAVAHYAAALPYRDRLGAAARALLLQEYALECQRVDDVQAARLAQDEALECWRRAGDRIREAECLRRLSTIMFFQGEPEAAMQAARAAVSILESEAPDSSDLALALATLAQRSLLEWNDDDATIALGRRAMEMAERIGYEPAAVDALTTVAVAELYNGHDLGWAHLEESRARATAADLNEAVTRNFINLVDAAMDLRRQDLAHASLAEALPYAEQHGLVLEHRVLLARQAELALWCGDWDVAGRQSQALVDRIDSARQVRERALTLLGRIRARTGDGDPGPLFDEALATIGPSQLQELCPLHAARAEAAWILEDEARTAREAMLGLLPAQQVTVAVTPWLWAELAFWAWRSGAIDELPEDIPEPYRHAAGGRHAEAAAAWEALGFPYEAATALAESDDVGHLQTALSVLNDLGAAPMARRVAVRLRALGERRIPRGPRASTRGNPARLTAREVEVLGLVADGLRNAQIAARLVLSVKTVDRHTSSILRKLEVDDRDAAAREAFRLGVRFERKDG